MTESRKFFQIPPKTASASNLLLQARPVRAGRHTAMRAEKARKIKLVAEAEPLGDLARRSCRVPDSSRLAISCKQASRRCSGPAACRTRCRKRFVSALSETEPASRAICGNGQRRTQAAPLHRAENGLCRKGRTLDASALSPGRLAAIKRAKASVSTRHCGQRIMRVR